VHDFGRGVDRAKTSLASVPAERLSGDSPLSSPSSAAGLAVAFRARILLIFPGKLLIENHLQTRFFD
jgi:hypothetical protein